MAGIVSFTTGRLAGVAEIALDDPAHLNPIGYGVLDGLVDAFEEIDSDPEIRCAILTGRGRAFSAGGDMSGVTEETAEQWYEFYGRFDTALDRLRGARKPVIAAVNGICYGAGMMLAGQCDLVVASEAARFGLIEGRMGSPTGGPFPYLVGPQWAKFLMLTGETISAHRAERIGFVLETVAVDRFAARVDALAARIAAMPPTGVMLNKQNVDGMMEMMGWNQGAIYTRALKAVLQSTAGQARSADGTRLRDVLQNDGLRAFIEARDAAFKTPWLADDGDSIAENSGDEQ
ncbi:MAG: enoyl-CoA hydratase/isomerase family protein [Actinobacteria bacterium]|nr:enoyl-CoA hydratase/isomerase family protein [Actinomycetota bacterium]